MLLKAGIDISLFTPHSTRSAAASAVEKQSKKEGNDQELIQSSTTPDPGYQLESDNVTIRHHK